MHLPVHLERADPPPAVIHGDVPQQLGRAGLEIDLHHGRTGTERRDGTRRAEESGHGERGDCGERHRVVGRAAYPAGPAAVRHERGVAADAPDLPEQHGEFGGDELREGCLAALPAGGHPGRGDYRLL